MGETKEGIGTQIMGLADTFGLPIAIDATSARPHEITLVDRTLEACFLGHVPEIFIGDRTYNSDTLDHRLAEERGVDLIALHKTNCKQEATQDCRVLRRFKRRWKMESGKAVHLAPILSGHGSIGQCHHPLKKGFGMTYRFITQSYRMK